MQGALRVAVVTRAAFPLHGFGGLERHVYDLVRHHLASGLQVTLVTRPPAPVSRTPEARDAWAALEGHPAFAWRFVPYHTFPLAGRRGTTVIDRSTAYPLFGLRAGGAVASLVRDGGIDVVYGLGASALGYARARRSGRATAPLVFNPQGLEEFGGADESYGGSRLKRLGYEPLRRAVRASAAAADVVIATDRSLEPVVQRQLGVDGDKLRLVPNGIDLAACDRLAGAAEGQAVRAAAGLGSGELVLLSAGRLQRNKGFHHLARALGAWQARRGWRWAIAGDGPYRGAIAAAASASGLASRVIWLGRIGTRDLHAWYEAADLFVHPTVYEGSSLVTLEAMAHRRPVLATRAGGLPDKVSHGVTGWLVEPGTPAALARALDEAVQARERWPAMGAAGRALAETAFDWPVIERQLTAIYEALVDRTRQR